MVCAKEMFDFEERNQSWDPGQGGEVHTLNRATLELSCASVVLLHSAFGRSSLFDSQYPYDKSSWPQRGDSRVADSTDDETRQQRRSEADAEEQDIHESIDDIHRCDQDQVSICIG
jgi:hypothetical protein